MPSRIPPNQVQTRDWPVLHYGRVPKIDLEFWRFRLSGLLEQEAEWTYDRFRSLPTATVRSDIHCVTGWSRLDNTWEGVLFRTVLQEVRLLPEARFAIIHAAQGFTTNLPLQDLMGDDVLFAWAHNGTPLTPDHGGPLRLVVPHLYFWKSAKWVTGVEFTAEDRPGFWEERGYHMRGDPWREERFGDPSEG